MVFLRKMVREFVPGSLMREKHLYGSLFRLTCGKERYHRMDRGKGGGGSCPRMWHMQQVPIFCWGR